MRAGMVGALATVFCVALGIASPAWAKLRPRVEAGLHYSTLVYDEKLSIWDNQWRPSFTGGVALEILQRGRFTLVSGLRYVQEGNKVEFDTALGGAGIVGEFRVHQDYLAVPAQVELRLLDSQRLFLSLGPEVGFLMSGRQIIESAFITGISRTELRQDNNIKDDLKPTNVTLNAGAGFEFPTENHAVLVHIRYLHGLVGVAEEEAWFSDWKTQAVELTTGFRW